MRKTKIIKIRDLSLGGGNPVLIQSMIKTRLEDAEGVLCAIKELKKEGCEIIRVAYKSDADTDYLKKIIKNSVLPLELDIHFQSQLALNALRMNADAIRINPGNMEKKYLKEVVLCAKERRVPIRIGINKGSLPQAQKGKVGFSDGCVKLIKEYVNFFKDLNYDYIVISAKSDSVLETFQANAKIASLFNYPIHLGITATGLGDAAIVKSSIGIGSLLLNGIGDTIRVSLTQDPLQEVKVAKEILSALELRRFGPEVISCPGCSRANIDILKISKKLTSDIKKIGSKQPLKIAIMGCEVNGPGEARDSDIGIAGGKNCAVLFKRGRIVKRVLLKNIKKEFLHEVKAMLKEKER